MTITTEPDAEERGGGEPDARPAPASEAQCDRCGAPMASDQEWCLECGEAHTLVHRPPDWRIGVAIVATVIVLALAGFAIALIDLSADASSSAARSVTGVSSARTATTAAPARFPDWASGQTGYTVVLSSDPSRAAAQSTATRLRAAGLQVGILNSSAHPRMHPGRWVVFTGHFPTHAAAKPTAVRLRARGFHAESQLVG